MGDTCCFAYVNGEVNYAPSMEDILYDSEYAMYNLNEEGVRTIDYRIYYQLFHCND